MDYSQLDIIDIFTHITPPRYAEALDKKAKFKIRSSMANKIRLKALTDIEERLRMMDKFPKLKHVFTVPQPPLEDVVDAKTAVELARMSNDEMAEICQKYPDKFIAVANLPMNDIDAALKETERTIKQLNFKGIQLCTPSQGKAIDRPEYMELYALMTKFGLPIWIHPTGEDARPDYSGEEISKYELHWSIGWPYQTTLAMARLVYSGVFDKYPNLNFVTHHYGAMVPFFAHRLCVRRGVPSKQSCEEQFRLFYADTAVSASEITLKCGYEFFGPDRTVFGTDVPFGGPEAYTRTAKTLAALESLGLPESAMKKIISGNARKILGLNPID
jgi:predicted TIM-barrel fold metal-dependent hydrolase